MYICIVYIVQDGDHVVVYICIVYIVQDGDHVVVDICIVYIVQDGDHVVVDICSYDSPAMMDCMFISELQFAQSNPAYANLFKVHYTIF